MPAGGSVLVLRRRAGESVLIGDEIEVELLAVTQQGAKIGIRAPKETIVLRKELKITQDQNTQAALGPSVSDLEQAIKKLRP
jgi:carbon storage regulator